MESNLLFPARETLESHQTLSEQSYLVLLLNWESPLRSFDMLWFAPNVADAEELPAQYTQLLCPRTPLVRCSPL